MNRWEGGRTIQWVEQAGKGGKRKTGRLTTVIPSAPRRGSLEQARILIKRLIGGSLGPHAEGRPDFRLPLPSLFNPLRRPRFLQITN